MGVGRVIARPFVGAPGAFTRTANRHDYALPPTGTTLLDAMTAAGKPVHAIGKIQDLFAGRGITTAVHTKSDDQGVDEIEKAMRHGRPGAGLHQSRRLRHAVRPSQRSRPATPRISSASTRGWRGCCRACAIAICSIITADHGNDPTTPSTDHAREYVPLFLVGAAVRPGHRHRHPRQTFADLGQTIAEIFGVGPLAHGTSASSVSQVGGGRRSARSEVEFGSMAG